MRPNFDTDRVVWLILNQADKYAVEAETAQTNNKLENANEAKAKEIALRHILVKIFQEKIYIDHFSEVEIGL